VRENDDSIGFEGKVVVVADVQIHLMMLLIECQLNYKLAQRHCHHFRCENNFEFFNLKYL
jgi:hypothetical protein